MTELTNDRHGSAQESSNRRDPGIVLQRPLATLTIVEGCGTGHLWELRAAITLLGRGLRTDIVLDFGDRTIHRAPHAAIEIDGGHLRVHDVRHGNPVFVNDRAVDGHGTVKFGDRIRIGMTTLRVDPAQTQRGPNQAKDLSHNGEKIVS